MEADVDERAVGSIQSVRALLVAPTNTTARALAIAMLLLPIAYIDPVLIPVWTPRMAVTLLVVPIGLAHFATDIRRRDHAALWFAGIMLACTIGTLIGDAPLWNLRGGFGRDSSLTFLLILAAFWSAARSLDRDGRRLVIAASLAGVAMSGLVAVAQVVATPPTGTLALLGERPGGLFANPVYLGAATAGAVTLTGLAWARRSCTTSIGIALVALFAACVSLSGSRGAAIASIVGLAAALARAGNRTRLLLVASTSTGWVGAQLLSNLSGGRDVAARTTLEDAGRSTVWKFAMEAIAERPVFGYGFGQFRAAVQPHFDAEFVRDHARDAFQDAWPDAHNIVFQVGVVGGFAALVCVAGFAFAGLVHARGPAAWAVVAIALTWMLQPLTLATGPMAFAWLGVAMAATAPSPDAPERRARLLVALGATMAIGLLLVDQQIYRLLDHPEQVTALIDDLPSDPVLAGVAANRQSSIGDYDDAVYWARRVADMEPFSAVAQARVAEAMLEADDGAGAAREIRRALEIDPYNPEALRVGLGVALVTDDDDLFDLVIGRLDEIELG